jgi:glutamate formiminotransferase
MECVPNFSEGRNTVVIEQIADAFRCKEGVRLLDYSADPDHNRSVVTAIGEPEALGDAVIDAVGQACELIDMNRHEGQHPRMGAADVIPFIPIRNVSEAEAVELSRSVGRALGERYNIPVFLYEKSASASHRQNLANVRQGQYEGLAEKMKDLRLWRPDFGPDRPHPTFGAVAVGARTPLCAFNVNLGTSDLAVADAIAEKVRHIGGGLRFCKAMGVELAGRRQTQVSMNLTDYTKTSIYSALEMVRMEARRYGVPVVGSEVIGLLPLQALVDCVEYYMGIEHFSADQVIEKRVMEIME